MQHGAGQVEHRTQPGHRAGRQRRFHALAQQRGQRHAFGASTDFAARTRVERAILGLLLLASLVAILTTLGIFLTLVFETTRFFGMVNPVDFLFGTH